MSVDRFWSVVDGTRRDDPTGQADILLPRLTALSRAELTGYHRRYVQLTNAIATTAHYAAAQVIMGSVGQDTFVSFRTWVVYQGRAVYDAFLTDPDSLADHGPTDDEQIGATELLEFLPDQVAGAAAPPWSDDTVTVYIDPTGPSLDDRYGALRQRFPRLAAAYLPPDLHAETPDEEGPREIRRRS